MKTLLCSALAVALCLSACKKDDDNSTPQSRIVGTWIKTADRTTVSVNNVTATQDNYASLNPCEKDDLYLFTSNGIYVRDEGQTRCRSTDSQTDTLGSWALFNNDTRLRAAADTFDVIQLSSSDMKLRRVYASGNASTIDTVTYSKR